MDRNKLIRDRSTKPLPNSLKRALLLAGTAAVAAANATGIVMAGTPKRW